MWPRADSIEGFADSVLKPLEYWSDGVLEQLHPVLLEIHAGSKSRLHIQNVPHPSDPQTFRIFENAGGRVMVGQCFNFYMVTRCYAW